MNAFPFTPRYGRKLLKINEKLGLVQTEFGPVSLGPVQVVPEIKIGMDRKKRGKARREQYGPIQGLIEAAGMNTRKPWRNYGR
jgi:hypothetical protein